MDGAREVGRSQRERWGRRRGDPPKRGREGWRGGGGGLFIYFSSSAQFRPDDGEPGSSSAQLPLTVQMLLQSILGGRGALIPRLDPIFPGWRTRSVDMPQPCSPTHTWSFLKLLSAQDASYFNTHQPRGKANYAKLV